MNGKCYADKRLFKNRQFQVSCSVFLKIRVSPTLHTVRLHNGEQRLNTSVHIVCFLFIFIKFAKKFKVNFFHVVIVGYWV